MWSVVGFLLQSTILLIGTLALIGWTFPVKAGEVVSTEEAKAKKAQATRQKVRQTIDEEEDGEDNGLVLRPTQDGHLTETHRNGAYQSGH